MYTAAQTKPMGENANEPGIGVRRAMLVWSRAPAGAPDEDVMVTHFDFLNLTGGNPDDTWTAGDFDTLDGLLTSHLTQLAPFWHPSTALDQFRWYRLGPGIPTPNPPVKITETNIVGTGTGDRLPPQCAITVTDRTGVRKEWGRKYFPLESGTILSDSTARLINTWVDVLAEQIDALYGATSTVDFIPVVYGPTRKKAYSIESVQVDDIVDIQRKRRWESPLYKRRIPAGG